MTERTVLDAFQKRGPFVYDHRIVRADGAVRVLHTRGDIICDSAGRPVRIVGSCWDVTEWKEINLRLQRSVSLLEATFEATADGLLVVDRDGLITAFNQRFVALWKIPRNLVGEHTDDAAAAAHPGSARGSARIAPGDAPRCRDNRRPTASTCSAPVTGACSNATRRRSGSAPRSSDGYGAFATSRLTPRWKGGCAKGRAQLELAVHAAHIGLWDWDLRSNQVFYSAEWKHQLGYEDHDIGNSLSEWHERVHPDDRQRLRNTVDAFIEKPWPGYNLEYRMRHRDGSYRWILAQASLLHDDAGIPIRMIGSQVDVTERKREEEAAQADRRRSGALIEGQKHVLEMIARGAELDETLTALVQLVEAQSVDTLGSVLLLDDDGTHVRHRAAPSLPRPSSARSTDRSSANAPARAAPRRSAASRSWSRTSPTDPLWTDHRQLALSHGLRACWSTPILDAHGDLLGTFAIYLRRSAQPSVADVRLIEMATHTAAIAITRKREEETLRASEDRLRQANIELERRVAERTREFEAAMREAHKRRPAQVGVPRDDVARAADAAQLDHRVHRHPAAGPRRAAQRRAAQAARHGAGERPPPARAHQRRPRHLEDRGRPARDRARRRSTSGRGHRRLSQAMTPLASKKGLAAAWSPSTSNVGPIVERPAPHRAGPAEPAQQRRQVHRARRGARVTACRGRSWRPRCATPASASGPSTWTDPVQAVSAGGHRAHARTRGPVSACRSAPTWRAARRRHPRQKQYGVGQRLHLPPAAARRSPA